MIGTARQRLGLVLGVFLIGLGMASCGSDLRGNMTTVRELITKARNNGAYTCAPRELALAESHADFTDNELRQGNGFRAQQHYNIAAPNAKYAFDRSPPEKCLPKTLVKVSDRDGDGIPDHLDRCPDEPEDFDGYEDEDGCPDPDNDADTVADKDDLCPNEPGPPENGGCPDTDRDGDGVVDRLDKCPDEPGPADNDGCPKKVYKLVVVTKGKIEIKQKIFFLFNKTKIVAKSHPVLNDVALALKDNPKITVRIEGHTDSIGSAAYNKRLSDGRAKAIRTYLVGQGIAADRMDAVGFGFEQPIASNKTEEGREQNRRVEFVITGGQ
jgi:outer membrane protein OmpA-like peptidoglycan-associated protein